MQQACCVVWVLIANLYASSLTIAGLPVISSGLRAQLAALSDQPGLQCKSWGGEQLSLSMGQTYSSLSRVLCFNYVKLPVSNCDLLFAEWVFLLLCC